MGKIRPLERVDGQHFTLVASQAVVWTMAPGQDTAQGGSMQCLLQGGGQPAQPHSTKVWGRETVEQHEAAGHRALSSSGSRGKDSRRGFISGEVSSWSWYYVRLGGEANFTL